MWIMIALVGGSLLVSQHDTREACEGRLAVIQKDVKPAPHGQCVNFPSTIHVWNSGTLSNTIPLVSPN